MNGVIERVNILIKDLGLTPNAFAKKVGLGSSNLSRKLKGSTPFTTKDYLNGLNSELLFVKNQYQNMVTNLRSNGYMSAASPRYT